ncbi:MAG: hypothetical protein HRU09_14420 [Oligoflexales bacterium]|nr:hypothetical protein [Oligoflexales bacterium]
MHKLITISSVLVLFSCGGDDTKTKSSISFDSIRFCTQTISGGTCESSKTQISEGTTRVYSSAGVNFDTTASSFSFNWYLVNESGCRTSLSKDTVVPEVSGEQVLTGFYMNTGGLTKGLYELEIVFNAAEISQSAVAQFSVN